MYSFFYCRIHNTGTYSFSNLQITKYFFRGAFWFFYVINSGLASNRCEFWMQNWFFYRGACVDILSVLSTVQIVCVGNNSAALAKALCHASYRLIFERIPVSTLPAKLGTSTGVLSSEGTYYFLNNRVPNYFINMFKTQRQKWKDFLFSWFLLFYFGCLLLA